MTTLVLNADAQPVSILPLSIVDWQESIRYLVLDKVSVMAWYEDWVVRSARWETRVPAVIMLKEYQKPKQHVKLSKRNIFFFYTRKFPRSPSSIRIIMHKFFCTFNKKICILPIIYSI